MFFIRPSALLKVIRPSTLFFSLVLNEVIWSLSFGLFLPFKIKNWKKNATPPKVLLPTHQGEAVGKRVFSGGGMTSFGLFNADFGLLKPF